MKFARPGGGTVEVAMRALALIDLKRQREIGSSEAGGLLLGRTIRDSKDVIIDTVSLPQALDRMSRFRFVRARRPAQRLVTRTWEESEGVRNYLGEWHTHPEDSPTPSFVDISDWKRIAAEVQSEHASLLFLIAGRVELRLWEACRKTFKISGLTIVSAPDAQISTNEV